VTFIRPPGEVSVVEGFSAWYEKVEPRVRLALMAAYGLERGREAAAEALAWAWEHQDRLEKLTNPVAYLYRVGQSRTRLRRVRVLHSRPEWSEPWVEPALHRGLAGLSERQRVAVVLVYGYGWTFPEVAELLEVKVTTVQTHLERGLARLRSVLEAQSDG
jgi:DNA-directed RNA polymerase specialized sigma24 family protein